MICVKTVKYISFITEVIQSLNFGGLQSARGAHYKTL